MKAARAAMQAVEMRTMTVRIGSRVLVAWCWLLPCAEAREFGNEDEHGWRPDGGGSVVVVQREPGRVAVNNEQREDPSGMELVSRFHGAGESHVCWANVI